MINEIPSFFLKLSCWKYFKICLVEYILSVVIIPPKGMVIIPFKLVFFWVFFSKNGTTLNCHLNGKTSHPYGKPYVKAVARSPGSCRLQVFVSLHLMLILVEVGTPCFGYHRHLPCFPAPSLPTASLFSVLSPELFFAAGNPCTLSVWVTSPSAKALAFYSGDDQLSSALAADNVRV